MIAPDEYTISRCLIHLLRKVRVEAGLRQADLAYRLEQPQSFVSKYETGERKLSLLEVRGICAALDISLEEFIRRWEGSIREA